MSIKAFQTLKAMFYLERKASQFPSEGLFLRSDSEGI